MIARGSNLYILKGRTCKRHQPSEPKRDVTWDMPGSRKEDAVWEVLRKLRWSLRMSNIATDISVADRFSWAVITKTKADRFAVFLSMLWRIVKCIRDIFSHSKDLLIKHSLLTSLCTSKPERNDVKKFF